MKETKEIRQQFIRIYKFINLFLEIISKAISKMTEKVQDIEKLLKTYFEAGVTPEFADNSDDAETLKGGLELNCLCVLISEY